MRTTAHKVELAITDDQILKCKKVVLDLRPHIHQDEYLDIIKKMISEGFQLIYLEENNEAVAFAGFISGYKLHRGNHIYIDDLNTLPGYRKKGYAGILMDWIFDYASENGMKQVHLDSGVQRFDAHRFYLKKGFSITSHHFAIKFES